MCDYSKRLERDWGDEVEVNILSQMLKMQVHVWNRYGCTRYGEGDDVIEIVHIEFGPGGMGHYNGLRSLQ